MERSLDRPAETALERFSTAERYRVLTTILESFTATLDLQEVLRRIVTITRDEFGADRAFLAHPVSPDADFTEIRYSASAADVDGLRQKSPIPLGPARAILNHALQ